MQHHSAPPALQVVVANILPVCCGYAIWAVLALRDRSPEQSALPGLAVDALVLGLHSACQLLGHGYKESLAQKPALSLLLAALALGAYCAMFMSLRWGGGGLAGAYSVSSPQRGPGSAMLQTDKGSQHEVTAPASQDLQVDHWLETGLLALQRGLSLIFSLGIQLGMQEWDGRGRAVAPPGAGVQQRGQTLDEEQTRARHCGGPPPPAAATAAMPGSTRTPEEDAAHVAGALLGLQRSAVRQRLPGPDGGESPVAEEHAAGVALHEAAARVPLLGLQRSAVLLRRAVPTLRPGSAPPVKQPDQAPAAAAATASPPPRVLGFQRGTALWRRASRPRIWRGGPAPSEDPPAGGPKAGRSLARTPPASCSWVRTSTASRQISGAADRGRSLGGSGSVLGLQQGTTLRKAVVAEL
uniref:Uncharacterized protein n=1 Tax=Alexandrium monilatum TaxID=311494 RepID=A0A7S4V7G6_9DINO